MNRVNVYDRDSEEDAELLGWFDADRAALYIEDTDWDGSNQTSVNTRSQWEHEGLYRTAQGRWVLHRWSDYQGTLPSYEFVSAATAREWLLANHQDNAVREHFGEVEPERGPGRPEVGPAVNVRFPSDLLARVDAQAQREGLSRAEMIRRLADRCLANAGR